MFYIYKVSITDIRGYECDKNEDNCDYGKSYLVEEPVLLICITKGLLDTYRRYIGLDNTPTPPQPHAWGTILNFVSKADILLHK